MASLDNRQCAKPEASPILRTTSLSGRKAQSLQLGEGQPTVGLVAQLPYPA